MRPQNKNRMRSRNNNPNHNNNRNGGGGNKGGNPLQRGYESNGPDVKIRGTAQHVAEKYGQLARDAQASGDHVLAENYFQHAEHYYRLIVTYQAQQAQYNQQRNDENDQGDNDGGDQNDGDDEPDDSFEGRQHRFPQQQQQQQHQHQSRPQGDREPRYARRGPRPEETEQPPVAFPIRPEEASDGAERPRRERFDRGQGRDQQRREAPAANDTAAEPEAEAALPSFLTRTRRPRRTKEDSADDTSNSNAPTKPASEA